MGPRNGPRGWGRRASRESSRLGPWPLAIVVLILAGCGASEKTPATPPRDLPASRDAPNGFALQLLGRYPTPIDLVQRPGAGLYVVEREGRIVPARGGAPLLDIRRDVATSGEAGMLSAAFAPGPDGRLDVAYSGRDARLHVDEFRLTPAGRASLRSRREVLAVPHPNDVHWGGLLMYGPDGELYLGTGDGGPPSPIPPTAQDPDSLLGKMLRLHPAGARAEVVAMGLRNPWRYSFDRRTGDLWIGDVGDYTQEEIDHVRLPDLEGSNFGWPDLEGTAQTKSDVEAHPPLVGPATTYARIGGTDDPYCAVTGGYVVRSPGLPALAGEYLYADFCYGALWVARVKASGDLGTTWGIGVKVEHPASFAEDRRGRLYAISLDGPVYRIVQR